MAKHRAVAKNASAPQALAASVVSAGILGALQDLLWRLSLVLR